MFIYIFILLILIILSFTDFSKTNQRNGVLLFISVVMVIFIGFRGESGADSCNYIDFFKYNTDTIWNWRSEEKGYAEYGFYYLSVLLKSIWNNIDFYFTCISMLTMFFLYKILKEYSLYPILGFIVYYSRFLIIRDMNQIRQALAMVIIIWGIKYLIQNKNKSFILLILLCSMIHYSSLIVLPFVVCYKYEYFPIKRLMSLLAVTFILSITGSVVLKVFLLNLDTVLIDRYVGSSNLGFLNPVLFFQIMITILFFYFEPILKNEQKGYYIIRNAYLYSTLILLLTSNLGEIGGRLATIFATCEIFILPAFVRVIRPHYIGFIIVLLVSSALFCMNYLKLLKEIDSWVYFS